MKVCIDSGHGGNDPELSTETLSEKDDVLKLLAVKPLLEVTGNLDVLLTLAKT